MEADFRDVRSRNIGVQARATAPGGSGLEISVESYEEAKIHGSVFVRGWEARDRAALVVKC